MLRNLNQSSGGRRICGTPHVGILAATIAANTVTGDDGAGLLYDDAVQPGNAGKELRLRILGGSAVPLLFVYEDGSYDFAGAPNGTYTLNYAVDANGVNVLASDTATWTVGGSVSAGGGTLAITASLSGGGGSATGSATSGGGTISTAALLAGGGASASSPNAGGGAVTSFAALDGGGGNSSGTNQAPPSAGLFLGAAMPILQYTGASQVSYDPVLGMQWSPGEQQQIPDAATAAAYIAAGWVDVTSQQVMSGGYRYREHISVRDWGARGDGMADDSQAIQRALTYAAAVATPQRPVTVQIPEGTYLVSPQVLMTNTWRYCLLVKDNVRVVGPGTLIYNIALANQSAVFLVRGDNITFDGLRFYNTYSGTSPWSVEIAGGDAFDDGIDPARIYKNLYVRGCEFINTWLAVSIQFSSATGNTCGYDRLRIEDSYAEGKLNATSGGNFNYKCDPPGRITNADITNCHALRGVTSSGFNYVGVLRGSVSNCVAYSNQYAGAEFENGCEQITISNFRAVSCNRGLWIDDSAYITANNIIVQGDAGTATNALYITRGGFLNNTGYVTQGISVSNFVTQNGRIRIEPYTPSAGAFGVISITDAKVFLDGTNQAQGLFFASLTTDLVLDNVLIYGAASIAFTGTMNTPGWLRMSRCVSAKVGAEASNGVSVSGTGGVQMAMCNLHTAPTLPTSKAIVAGNVVAGVSYAQNINI